MQISIKTENKISQCTAKIHEKNCFKLNLFLNNERDTFNFNYFGISKKYFFSFSEDYKADPTPIGVGTEDYLLLGGGGGVGWMWHCHTPTNNR